MSDALLLEPIDGRGVARVTLNRPAIHNAFDEALIAELVDAFGQLARDPAVRVILIAAAGRSFCAGADIAWMRRAAAQDEAANLEDARRFGQMMQGIYECPRPVVARIQGAAYGGGVGIVAAADIAIASTRARFSVSEAKLGILPAVIGPYLVNALGPRQARRLALTSSLISAEEALTLGLVQQVVEESALDAAVDRCLDELLQGGPEAQRHIKRLFHELAVAPVTETVRDFTARAIAHVRASDEARTGFEAFIAKRSAPWVPQASGKGTSNDRLEQRVLLEAPLAQVWRAISDSSQFGRWFGVAFETPFSAATRVQGRITPTTVDTEVAKLQQPHAGKAFEIWIERLEPQRTLAFRWHPYDIDPSQDRSQEPTTLVVFELQAAPEGTHLTISESGFDQLPRERRAQAYAANASGWSHQAQLIKKYLALQSQD